MTCIPKALITAEISARIMECGLFLFNVNCVTIFYFLQLEYFIYQVDYAKMRKEIWKSYLIKFVGHKKYHEGQTMT